jgi:hypothetical protein
MEINNIEEARTAKFLKLTDDYEAVLAAQPENVRKSTRMQRIIAFLKDNNPATLKNLAMALYNRPDTASVNQLVNALEKAKIISVIEKTIPDSNTNKNLPGIKGRPKVTNDEIVKLGTSTLRKFAKGQTDFTPEEIDFITQLYNAATAISEAEIAEVSKEEIAENVSDLAIRFTSEYTENPDKYFEKGIADEIEEIDGQQVRAIVGYYIPEGGANQGDEEVEDIGYIYSKSGQDLSSYAGEDFEDAFNNSLRINEINIDRWNKLAGLI